jgi:hypothetical protein
VCFDPTPPVFLMPTLRPLWTNQTYIDLTRELVCGAQSLRQSGLNLIAWLVLLRIASSGVSSRAEPPRRWRPRVVHH